jgi:hypothetical protein
MAPKKPEFDKRLIEAGVPVEELRKLRNDGFSIVFLYQTNGFALDEWQQAYYAPAPGKLQAIREDIKRGEAAGRIRNFVEVPL